MINNLAKMFRNIGVRPTHLRFADKQEVEITSLVEFNDDDDDM